MVGSVLGRQGETTAKATANAKTEAGPPLREE